MTTLLEQVHHNARRMKDRRQMRVVEAIVAWGKVLSDLWAMPKGTPREIRHRIANFTPQQRRNALRRMRYYGYYTNLYEFLFWREGGT